MSELSIWLEAIILGLVQGLTEFLPVSSSAHLRIIGPLLPSGGDPGAAFTAITQLGTEAAVLLYFRKDILRIVLTWMKSLSDASYRSNPDARMGWLIIIGTVPISVLGLLFKDYIEGSLRNLYLTATMLIVFALILGYTREAAARYSFLLAVPAVIASGFYQLYRSWGEPSTFSGGPTLLATVIAFVVGYGVIVVFLKLVSTKSYMPFVYYRIALGLGVIALLGMGVLSAV